MRLTQSADCRVELRNAPRTADAVGGGGGCQRRTPAEPCTKVKVVAISISSVDASSASEVEAVIRSIGSFAADGRTSEVNTAIGLDFL